MQRLKTKPVQNNYAIASLWLKTRLEASMVKPSEIKVSIPA